MGNRRSRLTTPDLFAAASAREGIAPHVAPTLAKPEASEPLIVLPKDLSAALKRLDDRELKRLSEAVLAERAARGHQRITVVEKPAPKARVEAEPVALSTGKLNAVRAAFKAGVKPAQIARQFGVSQSDVRKVLASETKKR